MSIVCVAAAAAAFNRYLCDGMCAIVVRQGGGVDGGGDMGGIRCDLAWMHARSDKPARLIAVFCSASQARS